MEVGTKHALLEKVLFILEEIEHRGYSEVLGAITLHCCPVCCEHERHSVNCELIALVNEVRKELISAKA